ncbi:hypothetical protein DFH06DRAFT_1144707 [Mycena polygramma]|nr:hypothetical protein DFH06DRAFT_1144707 [Mycena polygramma]
MISKSCGGSHDSWEGPVGRLSGDFRRTLCRNSIAASCRGEYPAFDVYIPRKRELLELTDCDSRATLDALGIELLAIIIFSERRLSPHIAMVWHIYWVKSISIQLHLKSRNLTTSLGENGEWGQLLLACNLMLAAFGACNFMFATSANSKIGATLSGRQPPKLRFDPSVNQIFAEPWLKASWSFMSLLRPLNPPFHTTFRAEYRPVTNIEFLLRHLVHNGFSFYLPSKTPRKLWETEVVLSSKLSDLQHVRNLEVAGRLPSCKLSFKVAGKYPSCTEKKLQKWGSFYPVYRPYYGYTFWQHLALTQRKQPDKMDVIIIVSERTLYLCAGRLTLDSCVRRSGQIETAGNQLQPRVGTTGKIPESNMRLIQTEGIRHALYERIRHEIEQTFPQVTGNQLTWDHRELGIRVANRQVLRTAKSEYGDNAPDRLRTRSFIPSNNSS